MTAKAAKTPPAPAPFECVVNADIFRRVATCQSTEEVRYHLNGVHVEPGPEGAIMVATDGRRMLCIRDPQGHVANGTGIVTLTKPMMAALATPRKREAGPRTRWLLVRGFKAAIVELPMSDKPLEPAAIQDLLALVDAPNAAVAAYQWANARIDGNFPEWRKVVPQWPQPKHAPPIPPAMVVNGQFVQAFAQALRGPLTGGEAAWLRLIPTGAEMDPVLVFGDSHIDGFGILMPIRDLSKPEVPQWARTP